MKQRIATSAARTRHFELHEHVLESTAHTIQDPFLADGVTRSGRTSHRLSSALRICFVVWIAAVTGFIAGCGGGSGKNVQNQTTTTTYKIGGTASGLVGSGLVLQDNGSDNLTVTANGSFTFATAIANGAAYNVTVLTQPSNPAQACTVTNGSGTATAAVSNVQVSCAAPTYTIGGTVSGLVGTGLVLQNNGGNNLSITGNGAFTFSSAIASGAAYSVKVLTQPSSPAQTCTVANGSGTASANVTSVQVTCAAPSYTIGGAVSGLTGTGLVLQDNGGDNLTINANGNFTFHTAIASGSAYKVTVLTQPSSPAQTCTVTNGSGTATANVTNVQVACTTPSGYTIGGVVTGLTGTGLILQNNGGDNLSITADGPFTFSTGVASGAAYNVTVASQVSTPGQTCTVSNGGGTATANVSNVAVACAYNAAPLWGWLAGSNTNNAAGTYGTQGTGATANSPGARNYSVGWTDISGNLWLFGGSGRDSTGTPGLLNDLWKWSYGQWTWVSGSNVAGQQGSYGTRGTASPSNYPGGRASAVGWTDASGQFWLFGGDAGSSNYFNDLWMYYRGAWTWVSGSSTYNILGTYGTLGTAASANVPGARNHAATWTDSSGNLWLFGGNGYDSVGTLINGGIPTLNDLWKFTVSSGQWTWMGGSNTAGQSGNYGAMGTAAATNIPGARAAACHWTDKAGNFWLFGGVGYDSAGTSGFLNDLWQYNPGTGQWTWINGSNLTNQASVYGTEGTPAATNVPGARAQAACWMDPAGNFWVFGGNGTVTPATAPVNLFDDLWEYSAGQWTWVGGSNVAGQPGSYGMLGVFAASNLPEARYPAAWWTDDLGDFWMFGGFGEYKTNTASNLNDMWEYVP